MLKKIFCSVLALLTVLTLLAGCNKNGDTVETGAPETENQTEEGGLVLNLPALDYNKQEITIHTRGDEDPIKEIGLTEDGTALSSELYERTCMVEERLNVVLNASVQNSWSQYNTSINSLRNSIQNGEGTFDLIAGWSCRIPVLASEGLFYNLNQFEYFDSSEEWWSQSMVSSLTINDRMFFATGDISTSYMDGAFAVIFNQRLAWDYGYDYSTFYDVVSAGEWTIDYLYSLTKDLYDDKNGNDSRDQGDIFGLLLKESYNTQAFWSGSEICIIPNDGVNTPEISFDVERIQNVYDKVYNLIMNSEGAVLNTSTPIVDDVIAYFSEGGSVFLLQTLGNLSSLTNMEDDYGVLPVPKYDEAQTSYHSHLHACTLWSVPMDAKDPEMSAAVMTALGYYSNQYVVEPHYEKLLKTRYVKDTESGYMIDLIYDSIYMNFDSIYNEALGSSVSDKTSMPIFVFATLISQNSGGSVSAWWETNDDIIRSKYAQMLEGFTS